MQKSPFMQRVNVLIDDPSQPDLEIQHSAESFMERDVQMQKKPWFQLPLLKSDRINGILVNQIIDQQRIAEEDEAPGNRSTIIDPNLQSFVLYYILTHTIP